MITVENIIKKIWGDSRVTYEPLSGGYVNFTYKVSVDGDNYVLRINGKQNDFLGLSREEEVKVFKTAVEMGIAPKVLPQSAGEYLITEYIEKEEFNFKEPSMLNMAVEVLKKIHKIEGINRVFSPFDLVSKYLKGMSALNVTIPDDLNDCLLKIDEIERRSNKDRTYRKAYCHNDYFPFNILNEKNKLYVIDWELSGIGDIFFDLGTITFSSAFTRDQEEYLLKCYFGQVEDEHRAALKDMQYMNMLREATWAFLHSGMKEDTVNHNMNYLDWGNHIINNIKKGILHE